MIALTRLNKERLLVNPDLIKFVEQAPDTVITLLAGEKILVSESADEVIAKIMAFRRSLVPQASPIHALTAATTKAVPSSFSSDRPSDEASASATHSRRHQPDSSDEEQD